jgi:hypothetical protein
VSLIRPVTLNTASGLPYEQPVPCRLQVITQAALAEFRQGNAERGRSLFEGVLRNYPRRLDLWSVYLDQVTHHRMCCVTCAS